ncbi:MAG: class I SAM-dependent methyltransferase, partial [Planctomycetota bacterium]
MKRVCQRFLNFGFKRYCPVCRSWVRNFNPYGLSHRTDAQCPVCKSLERHRFVWVYFCEKTHLFDGQPKRMLHFAPEPEFERKFKKVPAIDYVSADLFNPRAMVSMDICRMDCSDESFDIVYCSHVLEHVQDDRKAIAEIYRVLKKNGLAVILVPITADKTVEDPSVTDPRERERLFGQHDHLRKYGPDFADRLTASPFTVSVEYVSDLFSEGQIKKT